MYIILLKSNNCIIFSLAGTQSTNIPFALLTNGYLHHRTDHGGDGVKGQSFSDKCMFSGLALGLVPFEDSPSMSGAVARSDFGVYSPGSDLLPAEGVCAPLVSAD